MNFNEIYVVVPVYNESSTIESVINDLSKYTNNIIIVDDGSIDNTCDIIKDLNIVLLRHKTNLGQGAALRTGIEFCIKLNAKFILTFDADGQHLASDIPHMFYEITSNKLDIILGSRFLGSASNIPFGKFLFLKIAIKFTKFISNIKLTDVHNGLRLFTYDTAMKLDLTENNMSHASRIIDSIKQNNLKYKEVPVNILYTQYSISKGQSYYKIIKTGLYILKYKLLNSNNDRTIK